LVIGIGTYQKGAGIHRSGFRNRQLRREIRYENNLKEGKESHWREDGTLEKTEIYRNGELIETTEFNEDA